MDMFCEQKARRTSLCLDYMVLIWIPGTIQVANTRHLAIQVANRRVSCQVKMAGTRCLGNTKVNSDEICYVTIFGRVTLLGDS